MNTTLKERITGGFVILALIVLLAPIVARELDHKSHLPTVSSFAQSSLTQQTLPQGPSPLSTRSTNQLDASTTAQKRADQITTVTQKTPSASISPTSERTLPKIVSKPSVASLSISDQIQAHNKILRQRLEERSKFVSEKKALEKTVTAFSSSSPAQISTQTAEKTTIPSTSNTVWAIQLGSFKNKKYAKRLVERLKQQHNSAFIKTVRHRSITLHRVLTGQMTKHDEAFKKLAQLNREFKVHGILVSLKSFTLK